MRQARSSRPARRFARFAADRRPDQRQHGELLGGFHADDGEIEIGVVGDDFAVEIGAVVEADLEVFLAAADVAIGDDLIGSDKESAAARQRVVVRVKRLDRNC